MQYLKNLIFWIVIILSVSSASLAEGKERLVFDPKTHTLTHYGPDVGSGKRTPPAPSINCRGSLPILQQNMGPAYSSYLENPSTENYEASYEIYRERKRMFDWAVAQCWKQSWKQR